MTAGIHQIGLGQGRDGVLQIPATAADGPLPLVVLFHGAGGTATAFLRLLASVTTTLRAAILAPQAVGRTWDALTPETRSILDLVDITGRRRLMGFGPDVAFLDEALMRLFRSVAIDPARIAIGGFSDGATYALSLGLINGDLFRRVVAFSPGFILDGERHGRPDVFISHGRRDEVLPISRASRPITQQLRQSGYSITTREFDGGHDVPDNIAREALEWAAA